MKGSQRPSRAGLKSAVGPRPPNPYNDKKKQALASKNTVVVNFSDLERMKDLCADPNSMFPERTYLQDRHSRAKDIGQISKTRVQAWPNTILADREKRERDKIKKLEDEEVSIFKIF